jgi:hypothetical protein
MFYFNEDETLTMYWLLRDALDKKGTDMMFAEARILFALNLCLFESELVTPYDYQSTNNRLVAEDLI